MKVKWLEISDNAVKQFEKGETINEEIYMIKINIKVVQ